MQTEQTAHSPWTLFRSVVHRPNRMLHADPQSCEALASRWADGHLTLDHFEPVEFADADDLDAERSRSGSRPCRKCALEPVAVARLRAAAGDPQVFVTFSAQPSMLEARGRNAFDFFSASETSQDRLARIAAATGLDTAVTRVGVVAYGFVGTSVVAFLASNFRTEARRDVTESPSATTVTLAWTYWTQDSSQIDQWDVDAAASVDAERDSWVWAELVTS